LAKKNNITLTDQVESRLEELFGANDEIPIEPAIDEANGNDSLADLKSLLLSIDWEITDEVMNAFIQKIERLKEKYKRDPVILWFLKLLGALGKHLKIHKNKAHPNTMNVLNSVYKGLEMVAGTKSLSETERKKILTIEAKKFKAIKDQLMPGKTGAKKINEAKTTGNKIPESKKKPQDATIEKSDRQAEEITQNALSEIKNLIRTEFKLLREEFKSGKKK